MLTLRPADVAIWSELLPEVLSGKMEPDGRAERRLEQEQVGAFRFFAGTALAARTDARAPAWLGAGAAVDGPDLRASHYVAEILLRCGHLAAPSGPFSDPRAFAHFSRLPAMQACRAEFVSFAVDSLPPESGSLRVLDIGCGDGGMLAELLPALIAAGSCDEVSAATLLDPSPAMLSSAKARIGSA